MKRTWLLALTVTLAFSACDKVAQNSEAQRLAEERAALERDRAALAQEKAAAQQAANEQERARLEAERAALESQKARMSGDRAAAAAAEHEAKLASERAKRLAAEERAASEAARAREAEIREREARETADAAEQARTTQTVDFFYDALDPYGDWVETDRYGYAFRPNAARDPRWRPYTDGGWVYTDYGWTWRSNEPFGWATYHYGRWSRVSRLGWVWVPNTEWGPAWVSWRRSDDYIGWAPLPPDAWSRNGFTAAVDANFDIGPGLYNFVRVADVGEPTYIGRVVAPEQNVTIVNQTVNVTNVTYQKVQNNMVVVNRGPDVTIVNQRSRVPVQHLAVQRVNAVAGKPAQVQGNVLQIVAPPLKAAPAPTKPKKVTTTVKAAEMEHGWAGAEADAVKIRGAARRDAERAEKVDAAPAVPPAPAFTPKPATAPALPTRPPRATPSATPVAPIPAKLPPAPEQTGLPTPVHLPTVKPMRPMPPTPAPPLPKVKPMPPEVVAPQQPVPATPQRPPLKEFRKGIPPAASPIPSSGEPTPEPKKRK